MSLLIKARFNHGYQAIKSIENAELKPKFRGFPIIKEESVSKDLMEKFDLICPTSAISNNPLSIDLGKCIFCGACSEFIDNSPIEFTNFHKIFGFKREDLIITSKVNKNKFLNVEENKKIKNYFKRSFKIRNVCAGGCNACELELSASFNVNFDASRFGIDIVASPRHADAILISGPITKNMSYATLKTWEATSEPKLCILFGTCAISKGVFKDSDEIDRSVLEKMIPVLYIPGCPVHPLTFIAAVKRLIGWGNDEP